MIQRQKLILTSCFDSKTQSQAILLGFKRPRIRLFSSPLDRRACPVLRKSWKIFQSNFCGSLEKSSEQIIADCDWSSNNCVHCWLVPVIIWIVGNEFAYLGLWALNLLSNWIIWLWTDSSQPICSLQCHSNKEICIFLPILHPLLHLISRYSFHGDSKSLRLSFFHSTNLGWILSLAAVLWDLTGL